MVEQIKKSMKEELSNLQKKEIKYRSIENCKDLAEICAVKSYEIIHLYRTIFGESILSK